MQDNLLCRFPLECLAAGAPLAEADPVPVPASLGMDTIFFERAAKSVDFAGSWEETCRADLLHWRRYSFCPSPI